MRLYADDFGCVPDGRVLTSVRVRAGSAQLEVLDGTVRPGDVGKHIAVPGAVDLVTTIAGLFRQKEFPGAMTAGSDQLTATLPPGDGFEQRVQRGLRITVAGAGPAGATLVTDVVDVPDRTTLKLAQAAAMAVNQARTILNDPDLAMLDDHARATAAPFTVSLGDRTVTVPGIIVGENTLFSPGAAFSSEDLTKPVTIPAAGCLAAAIEAVADGGGSITLSAPATRTASDGPADVWRTDSRPGFEQLLEALSHLDVENADICFSAGVYDFTWVPAAAGSFPAALKLYGLDNVTLRGAGQDVTVLRLMPDQHLKPADTHMLRARNCTGLTLRDLTVRGSYLTLASVGVQAHAILVEAGCADVVIERVGVFQSAGDAIRLIGEPDQKVRRVWVQGCRLVQNNRTGVAFQRWVEFVWVTDCYIETIPPSTQAGIDFEPSGTGSAGQLVAAADVVIDSNVLLHNVPAVAVSISGLSAAGDPAQRIQFTNNVLLGGVMGGVNAHDVTISGNTVITGDTVLAADTGQVMWIQGSFDGLRVTDNKIVASNGPLDGIHLSRHGGVGADGVRISGNDITAAGSGIMLDNPGSQVTIDGNRIWGKGQAQGIHIELAGQAGEVCRDMRITGNSVTSFADAGIQISDKNTAQKIDGLEISGNEISAGGPVTADLTGIRFARPGGGTDFWLGRPLVTGNRIADDVKVKIDRGGPTVPFLMLSGNLGGVAVYEGDSTPEGVLPSPPGSLFLSANDTAGAAAYLKISGTGPTGWVQLATVP
jgi:hypothetical protein